MEVHKLIIDLKALLLGNWKTILILEVVVYLVCYYPDIKQGFIDGWMNK
jgi:uncharacterized membrane protein